MNLRERLGYLAGTVVFGGAMAGVGLLVLLVAGTAPFFAVFFPLTLSFVGIFFALGYLRHRRMRRALREAERRRREGS